MAGIMHKKMSRTEEFQVRAWFRPTLTFTKIFLVDLLLGDHFKGSCHHNQGLLTFGEQIKNFLVPVINQPFQVSRALEDTQKIQKTKGPT